MARCRYPFGHFPFPVPHEPGAAPAGSFLAAPLQTVKDWYWRVQAWDFTFGCAGTTIQYPGDTFAVTACSATVRVFLYEDLGFPNILDERSLPQPCIVRSQGSFFGTGGGGATPVGVLDMRLFAGVSNDLDLDFAPSSLPINTPVPRVLFDPISGLYRPTFDVRASLDVENFTPGHSGFFEVGTGPIPSYVYYQDWNPACYSGTTITVHMEGFTQTTPGYILIGNVDPSYTVVTDFSRLAPTITITPALWWRYVGNDNVTLYNSSDGTPAINPATGRPFTGAEIAAAPVP